MALWFLPWHGLLPWAWPKKVLSTAVYSSRAWAWNYLLFEKILPRTGSRTSSISRLHRGHWFWKTNLMCLIDFLQKFHCFDRERRKVHSQSKLTGSSKCLAWLNVVYIFGFINHVSLIIRNPAGNAKDAATGAEGNMVRWAEFQAALLEEEIGGTQLCGLSRTGSRAEAGFHPFLWRQRSPGNTTKLLWSVLFNPRDLKIERGFIIPLFLIEATSVTQTWPKMTSLISDEGQNADAFNWQNFEEILIFFRISLSLIWQSERQELFFPFRFYWDIISMNKISDSTWIRKPESGFSAVVAINMQSQNS